MQFPLNVQKDMFHTEMEKLEERMVKYTRDGLSNLSADIQGVRAEV